MDGEVNSESDGSPQRDTDRASPCARLRTYCVQIEEDVHGEQSGWTEPVENMPGHVLSMVHDRTIIGAADARSQGLSRTAL
eukprot:2934087-Prymnesium_polylepis.1